MLVSGEDKPDKENHRLPRVTRGDKEKGLQEGKTEPVHVVIVVGLVPVDFFYSFP